MGGGDATSTTTTPASASATSISNNENQSPSDPVKILNVNVGVLGHVDSGKTSLVKALSTLLSTAALDKSTQSKERGMTLDLGFSCFFVDLPAQFRESYPDKDQLQITLVDCPGHASLIRTIIGGAQIIDMVLLVVDALKGWQAQTTECLVLAELTTPHLVVALNKVDLLDTFSSSSNISSSSSSSAVTTSGNKERDAPPLQLAKKKIRERLSQTRFADAPIIGVAACVGGEKVAAVVGGSSTSTAANTTAATTTSSSSSTSTTSDSPAASLSTSLSTTTTSGIQKNETHQMDRLVKVLKEKLPPPKRVATGPFYFSIDHCFSLRGRGTILTGTVLSGSASPNDVLEFPVLALERKIKSIQMFKQQVPYIQQGDRAGICVSNLDAKLIERGIAASPGAVHLWKGAIALVRKVPYYPGTLPCGSKFHISVGHSTVMATVTFWGAQELKKLQMREQQQLQQAQQQQQSTGASTSQSTNTTNAKKSEFTPLQSSSLGGGAEMAGLPRIPFDFNQIFLQQDMLLESLDDETDKLTKNGSNSSSSSNSAVTSKKITATTATTTTSKELPLLHWALIEFQTPVYCPLQSLAIGSRLDTVDNASGSVSSCRLAFSARLIESIDPENDLGRLRIYKPKERRGVVSRLGDPHKRTDDGKIVRYEVFGSDLFKKETNMKLFIGMKIETERGDIGEIKSSFGTSGKFRVYFPAGTDVREGDPLILRFQRFAHDPEKKMHQTISLPAARSGALLDIPKKVKKEKLPEGIKRQGEVSALKGDVLANGKHSVAIISGFFAPDVNIKERAGTKVLIPSTKEEGCIVGPFGKAGKCKVSFENGISAEVGTKAELQL